jgi:hypothetical protein
MADMRTQAVMGVIPPEVAEARIAVRWPSVAKYGAPAKLGSTMQEFATRLIRSTLHLPLLLAIPAFAVALLVGFAIACLAWLLLAPFFFLRLMPFVAIRYTLTNRRLMIQRGITAQPAQEVALGDITTVRVVPESVQPFYRSGDIEVLSGDRVALTLRAVKEPEQFKHIILNAYLAWGRKAPPREQIQPASELAKK